METNFIGRIKELRLLKELRAEDSGSSIAVVYGRRRVGKSFLIEEAYREEQIYTFEGLENCTTSGQISNFLKQLNQHFKSNDIGIDNWFDALMKLVEKTKGQPTVIVFDEFQWMANYRNELISTLKLVWDQYFSKNKNLTLVLCGSVASFMVNKVLKSKALYGRVRLGINLKPFLLNETLQILKNKGARETIETQLLLGGIPAYLKIIATKPSLTLGIQELAFEPHGYFTQEFDKIFISQFGSSEQYEKIVRLLAKTPTGLTRTQLAKSEDLKDGGTLSKHLNDLEIAEIISSYTPFHLNYNSKSRIYLLTDPYIRLYLNYIEKELGRIESGAQGIFLQLSKSSGFNAWKGLACEVLCYRHQYQLAKLMGFSDVQYQAGPYFQLGNKNIKGVQVDLVYDRKDSVITVCEIKYTDDKIGIEIVEQVEEKIKLIPNKKNKTIQRALIVKSEPSQIVKDSGYFSHIICLDQLLKSE